MFFRRKNIDFSFTVEAFRNAAGGNFLWANNIKNNDNNQMFSGRQHHKEYVNTWTKDKAHFNKACVFAT